MRQLRPLVVPILCGSLSVGIILPNLTYMGLAFFAQRYTDLPPSQIHCDIEPDTPFCKAAVNDNLAWQTGIGVVASVINVILGPLFGALSDTYGRRPVLLGGVLMKYPCLAALGVYAFLDGSLYPVFILSPLADLPIKAVWFAYIVDLLEDKNETSVAFGQITAATLLSVIVGVAIGTALSIQASIGVILAVDFGLLLPYMIWLLPETLPIDKRKKMDWQTSLPWKGMGILFRDGTFTRLSVIIVGHAFVDTGFSRVSTSYQQKFLTWPKVANSMAMGVAGASCFLWSSIGLGITTRRVGDLGTLRISLLSTASYMFLFGFVSQAWQVFVLNGMFMGPAVMAFPATSAITSRLVGAEEQGHLQGALSTGKSLAEAMGPVIFGGLFELTTSWGLDGAKQTMLSRTPIFGGGLLMVVLYGLLRCLPQLPQGPDIEQDVPTTMGKVRETEMDSLTSAARRVIRPQPS